MNATEKDITLVRGDNHNFTHHFTNEAGDPIDITGYKIMFTVKAQDTDNDDGAKIAKTLEITDGAAGGALLSIVPEDTNDVVPDVYRYDLQIVDTLGAVHTLLIGTLFLKADITRRVV